MSAARWIVATLGAALVLAFGYFVWPTPWRYEHTDVAQGLNVVVRIHRITGRTQWLNAGAGTWSQPAPQQP